MRVSPRIVAAAALIACRSSQQAEVPPPMTPSAVAERPASPAPPSWALAAGAAAPASVAVPHPETLSVFVEGACGELGVGFFDNGTVVHYGHIPDSRVLPLSPPVFAFVKDDGSFVQDDTVRSGLPASSLPELDIGDMSGSWPETASITIFRHGGERAEAEAHRFDRQGDKWVASAIPPDRNAVDRSVLGASWLSGSRLEPVGAWSPYPAFKVVPAGAALGPDFTALHVAEAPMCKFVQSDLLTRPTGELFLAGNFCGIFPTHNLGMTPMGEAAVARWAPGAPATLEPIPSVPNHADLHLDSFLEASPTALYLFGEVGWKEAYVALRDGASWSRIEAPFQGYVAQRELEPDGTLWVRTSKEELYRYSPSGKAWTKEPLTGVLDVAWVGGHPVWALVSGGIAHRDENGAWTSLATPRPAFSAAGASFELRRITLSPKGEAWVHATYEEPRPGAPANEWREALLRVGPPVAPTRCETAKTASFVRWPPRATAACTDLVAILARVSKSAPADYDFPQTRAALRGHDEVLEAELVEIEIDGKRLLAAKVKSIEAGTRLVDIETRGVRGTRPELVCTRPKVTRALTFDVQTGRLAPR